VRTVYLDQFEDDTAGRILEALDRAGIAWHVKCTGRLARTLFVGEWGTRIFVDQERLAEAREIATREVFPGDQR